MVHKSLECMYVVGIVSKVFIAFQHHLETENKRTRQPRVQRRKQYQFPGTGSNFEQCENGGFFLISITIRDRQLGVCQ